jgi:hypothetical protein
MKGRWSTLEHAKFIQAMKAKLKWKEVARAVSTRSPRQCRSHFQKMRVRFYNRLMKEMKKHQEDDEFLSSKVLDSFERIKDSRFSQPEVSQEKTMNNLTLESAGLDDWIWIDHQTILAFNEDQYIRRL